jgi:hypothetical protein
LVPLKLNSGSRVSIPASLSGGPGFKFQPGDQLSSVPFRQVPGEDLHLDHDYFLPYPFLFIHYSVMILSFNAIQPQQLTALLNKYSQNGIQEMTQDCFEILLAKNVSNESAKNSGIILLIKSTLTHLL